MPAISLSPPTRYLLRGSGLIAILLLVWWLLPFNPLQSVVRTTAEACGVLLFPGRTPFAVTAAANGDWTFEVPLEASLPARRAKPSPQQIHSIAFDLARSDAGAFTFGLPVFWALILAASGIRRSLRPLFAGTLAMAVSDVALILITAQILAHKALAQMLHSYAPVESWFLRFSEYLLINAIPYLLPFAVALWVHRELREQVLHWAGPVTAGEAWIPAMNPMSKRATGRKVPSKRNTTRLL